MIMIGRIKKCRYVKTFILRVILSFTLVHLTFPLAQAEWRLEDYIDNINPTSIFKPIEGIVEKMIPGLDFTGFVRNQTGVYLHDNRMGYDFNRIDWLTELELDYRTSNTRFDLRFNYRFDAMYDWTEDGRSASSKIKHVMRDYDSFEEMVREVWIERYIGDWTLGLGKKIVIWGKVDGKRVTDIVNSEDQRYGNAVPLDDRQFSFQGRYMADITYNKEPWAFTLLIVPDYEVNRSAPANSPFAWKAVGPPSSLITRYLPKDSPDDWSMNDLEVFFQGGFVLRGWDLKLIYGYTHSYTPTMYNYGVRPGRPPSLILEPRYVRLNKVGMNVDKSFDIGNKNFVFKSELLYTHNAPYGIDSAIRRTMFQVEKFNVIDLALSLGTSVFRDWSVSLTLSPTFVFNGDYTGATTLPTRIPLDINNWGWSASVTKAFSFASLQDRLKLTSIFYASEDITEGARWEANLSFEITEWCQIMTGYEFYWGNNERDLWGNHRDEDWIEFGVNWTF